MNNKKDELEDNSNEDFEEMIAKIKGNYLRLEKSIVNQLNMSHKLHGTTIGTQREMIWQELFEQFIPKKFVLQHSVFIIDSNGNFSKEVDLAIVDETYTPYIFQYGKLKFIPIEAVAVVVECKSNSQDKDVLIKWSQAISKLKTKGESIARMATTISTEATFTQKSTRPIRILCRMNNDNEKELLKEFDFILYASDKGQEIHLNSSRDDLYDWFKELNFYGVDSNLLEQRKKYIKGNDNKSIKELFAEIKRTDINGNTSSGPVKLSDYKVTGNNLLTFNFQLNQLLMLINNPIPFPHRAYVDMFNRVKEQE